MFRRLSRIRIRALLLGILPAAIMALTLTAYTLTAQLKNLERAFQERGNAIAHQTAALSIYGLFSGDTKILKASLQTIKAHPDLRSITIRDDKGQVLVDLKINTQSDDTSNSPDGGSGSHEFTAPVQFLIASEPIGDYPDQTGQDSDNNSQPRQIGSVTINLTNAPFRSQQRQIIINVLLLLLAGLLITGLIANALSRRVVKPLSRLTQSVIQMKHGDFSVRVPEVSKGELRSLEEGFNAMAKTLEDSQEILRHQVEQATADLTQTMEALEIQNVELDLARKKALKASTTKSKFLANMSHEIRTPMNGVIGFTKLLLKTELTEEQQDLAKTIERSASSLLKIINDILDYSKLEYGKLEPESVPFLVSDCFEDPIALLAPAAHDKGLELILLIYSDVPDKLIGDETRIRQILVNLLGNAIKFTHQGEIVVRVMREEETEDECVLGFTVADTGIGISEEIQQTLFTSFEQGSASTSRMYGGTGLGLSISRKLAETMHGGINVESVEGEGSTFHVFLKLPKAVDHASPPPSSPLAGKHCLLLDDHQLSRLSLQHSLSAMGILVTASDHAAISILEEPANTDIILLGFSAGNIVISDIEQLVNRLKARFDCPIVVLLSTSEYEVLERVQQLQVVRCLSKPHTSNSLKRIISEVLICNDDHTRHSNHSVVPACPHARFLVADDNPINLRLISTLLAQSGAEIIEVNNGRDAVKQARQNRIDIIFMDLHMPELDGYGATEQIRANEHDDRHTPIIALTADTVPARRDHAFRAGIDDFLIKPIDESQLWHVITHLLKTGSNITATGRTEPLPVDGQLVTSRDLQGAIRIAGGRADLAQDLFDRFLDELPSQLKQIKSSAMQKAWSELWEHVHRLLGAAAVCGVPRLERLLRSLEQAAEKADEDQIARLLSAIEKESRLLADSNATIS